MTKAEPFGLDLVGLVAASELDVPGLVAALAEADRGLVANFTGEPLGFPARRLRRGEAPEAAALIDAERARRRRLLPPPEESR